MGLITHAKKDGFWFVHMHTKIGLCIYYERVEALECCHRKPHN